MQGTIYHVRIEMRQSLAQRLNCGTAELQDKKYSVRGIRTAELILYVEAEPWNFKSQNILCAEAELQVTE